MWQKAYKRYSSKCLAPIFKSGHTLVMVWGAFSGFDKSPLIIIPPQNRSASDFVDLIYEGTLSGFYFLHDHREDIILMEDGAPVHRNKVAKVVERSSWYKEVEMAKQLSKSKPNREPMEDSERQSSEYILAIQ